MEPEGGEGEAVGLDGGGHHGHIDGTSLHLHAGIDGVQLGQVGPILVVPHELKEVAGALKEGVAVIHQEAALVDVVTDSGDLNFEVCHDGDVVVVFKLWDVNDLHFFLLLNRHHLRGRHVQSIIWWVDQVAHDPVALAEFRPSSHVEQTSQKEAQPHRDGADGAQSPGAAGARLAAHYPDGAIRLRLTVTLAITASLPTLAAGAIMTLLQRLR